MTFRELLNLRLTQQHLVGPQFEKPEDAVRWLGAVQSQDYPGAKWALGQRVKGITDAAIDKAFNEGKILRTHVMRPTWHFIPPEDILWMQDLTADRVRTVMSYYFREGKVTDTIAQKTNKLLEGMLKGGIQLTRNEIGEKLAEAGMPFTGTPLGFVTIHAELAGIICSGALKGKQQTYALVSERAPQAKLMPRDKALAELAKRYFTSHGPAHIKDFSWWSGLSIAESKRGAELAAANLKQAVIEGKEYWYAAEATSVTAPNPFVELLPNYDEYLIAYKVRDAYFERDLFRHLETPARFFLSNHIVMLDGVVVGGWRRLPGKKEMVVELRLVQKLNSDQNKALDHALKQYSQFLGLPVRATYRTA